MSAFSKKWIVLDLNLLLFGINLFLISKTVFRDDKLGDAYRLALRNLIISMEKLKNGDCDGAEKNIERHLKYQSYASVELLKRDDARDIRVMLDDVLAKEKK